MWMTELTAAAVQLGWLLLRWLQADGAGTTAAALPRPLRRHRAKLVQQLQVASGAKRGLNLAGDWRQSIALGE
jgi:hypothetical protein